MLGAETELKHRKNLGERIDGQPQPEDLLRTPQPSAQFVQLEVREAQIARCERSFKFCACKVCRRQPGGDRDITIAEDPLGGGRIQPFGERRQHDGDPAREGVFRRYERV